MTNETQPFADLAEAARALAAQPIDQQKQTLTRLALAARISALSQELAEAQATIAMLVEHSSRLEARLHDSERPS